MSGNPPAAVESFVRGHRVARLATVDDAAACGAYPKRLSSRPLIRR